MFSTENELFPPRVRHGEPLGAKTSMKKADGSAFDLAIGEPLASLADARGVHFTDRYIGWTTD